MIFFFKIKMKTKNFEKFGRKKIDINFNLIFKE